MTRPESSRGQRCGVSTKPRRGLAARRVPQKTRTSQFQLLDSPSKTSLTCTDLSPEPEADLLVSAMFILLEWMQVNKVVWLM